MELDCVYLRSWASTLNKQLSESCFRSADNAVCLVGVVKLNLLSWLLLLCFSLQLFNPLDKCLKIRSLHAWPLIKPCSITSASWRPHLLQYLLCPQLLSLFTAFPQLHTNPNGEQLVCVRLDSWAPFLKSPSFNQALHSDTSKALIFSCATLLLHLDPKFKKLTKLANYHIRDPASSISMSQGLHVFRKSRRRQIKH